MDERSNRTLLPKVQKPLPHKLQIKLEMLLVNIDIFPVATIRNYRV
jgi:hypothetical protein